jgi:hypothetical protein
VVPGGGGGADRIRYTIATLVTDHAQYAGMLASFAAGGFGHDCEILSIDNSGRRDQIDAYRGLDAMLTRARGDHVILCHQDIRLVADGRAELDRRLAGLDALDPDWALAGNAGGIAPGVLAIRISDPHGADQHVGNLPAKVASLDENFIVVRRQARVGFSRDLTGFHFYGADICLNAAIAGYSAYVIDFHLRHLSPGSKGPDFFAAEARFRAKWEGALAPRWLQTTCSLVRLDGSGFGRMASRMMERPFARFSRRLPRARGWKAPTHSDMQREPS